MLTLVSKFHFDFDHHSFRYQYTPNYHNSFERFMVRHFAQTPVKYTFFESLRILHYKGIFILNIGRKKH